MIVISMSKQQMNEHKQTKNDINYIFVSVMKKEIS